MGIPYAEVIGDPITHSKSPVIHKFWLEKLGIEGDYRRTRVTAEGLEAYLRERRADPEWRGCNLTMPLKHRVEPLLDRVFPEVKVARAVNTIVRHDSGLVGTNSDMRGFAEPFRDVFPDRGTALLIGSGGAARAIFTALAALGFGPVEIMARREEPRFPLADRLLAEGRWHPLRERLPSADLVVNATPIGMAGGPRVDFDLTALLPSAIVYDIVYNPIETPLLAAARRRGLRTVDGLTMLIGQAAYAFVHFFDGEPPRQHDAELRELLTR
ncbi:MAG TPA: shikimate dehydrogenase [Allosphingosinicella sp.]|jgi:shikimate dehydrogenase